MNILVINGPNLNLLGTREPEIYGHETLEELMMWLETSQQGSNLSFKFFQSNHDCTEHLRLSHYLLKPAQKLPVIPVTVLQRPMHFHC